MSVLSTVTENRRPGGCLVLSMSWRGEYSAGVSGMGKATERGDSIGEAIEYLIGEHDVAMSDFSSVEIIVFASSKIYITANCSDVNEMSLYEAFKSVATTDPVGAVGMIVVLNQYMDYIGKPRVIEQDDSRVKTPSIAFLLRFIATNSVRIDRAVSACDELMRMVKWPELDIINRSLKHEVNESAPPPERTGLFLSILSHFTSTVSSHSMGFRWNVDELAGLADGNPAIAAGLRDTRLVYLSTDGGGLTSFDPADRAEVHAAACLVLARLLGYGARLAPNYAKLETVVGITGHACPDMASVLASPEFKRRGMEELLGHVSDDAIGDAESFIEDARAEGIDWPEFAIIERSISEDHK